MKRRTGILGVLIAILLMGIGYAAISAVTLRINGTGTVSPNPDNFKVVYTAVTTSNVSTGLTVTPDAISADGDVTTSFTVTGMTKKGDTADLTYTITNKSPDLGATLGLPGVTISGEKASEYFQVTSSTAGTTLTANGGTTTQTVHVEVIKTPIDADVTGTFTITVQATPTNE